MCLYRLENETNMNTHVNHEQKWNQHFKMVKKSYKVLLCPQKQTKNPLQLVRHIRTSFPCLNVFILNIYLCSKDNDNYAMYYLPQLPQKANMSFINSSQTEKFLLFPKHYVLDSICSSIKSNLQASKAFYLFRYCDFKTVFLSHDKRLNRAFIRTASRQVLVTYLKLQLTRCQTVNTPL